MRPAFIQLKWHGKIEQTEGLDFREDADDLAGAPLVNVDATDTSRGAASSGVSGPRAASLRVEAAPASATDLTVAKTSTSNSITTATDDGTGGAKEKGLTPRRRAAVVTARRGVTEEVWVAKKIVQNAPEAVTYRDDLGRCVER